MCSHIFFMSKVVCAILWWFIDKVYAKNDQTEEKKQFFSMEILLGRRSFINQTLRHMKKFKKFPVLCAMGWLLQPHERLKSDSNIKYVCHIVI